MKRLLLITFLFGIVLNNYSQRIVYDTIDLSSWSGADTFIYDQFSYNMEKPITCHYNLIQVYRDMADSTTIDIGGSPDGTGFDQYTSEKFPYDFSTAATDTILNHLDWGDWCQVTPYPYWVTKITTTANTIPANLTIPVKFTIPNK